MVDVPVDSKKILTDLLIKDVPLTTEAKDRNAIFRMNALVEMQRGPLVKSLLIVTKNRDVLSLATKKKDPREPIAKKVMQVILSHAETNLLVKTIRQRG